MAIDAQPPSEKLQDVRKLVNLLSDEDKEQLKQDFQDKSTPIDKPTTTVNVTTSPSLTQPTQAQPTQAQPTQAQPTQAQLSQVQPSQRAIDLAWRLIVAAVVLAFFLASFAIIIIAITPIWIKPVGTVNSDILVTIFSTAIGFLAGILIPRPEGRR